MKELKFKELKFQEDYRPLKKKEEFVIPYFRLVLVNDSLEDRLDDLARTTVFHY